MSEDVKINNVSLIFYMECILWLFMFALHKTQVKQIMKQTLLSVSKTSHFPPICPVSGAKRGHRESVFSN
jgi:hypothetical protein